MSYSRQKITKDINLPLTKEIYASKALEQESQSQFLHFFISRGYRGKQPKQRINSKIATWDEDHEKINIHKMDVTKRPINFMKQVSQARQASKWRKINKNHTQTTVYKNNPQNESRPTFSISLLNPQIQYSQPVNLQQKWNKSKGGKTSALLKAKFFSKVGRLAKIDDNWRRYKLQNQRVHSLGSESQFQDNERNESNFESKEQKSRLIVPDLMKSKGMKIYKKNEIKRLDRQSLTSFIQPYDQQDQLINNRQIVQIIQNSKNKLRKSLQFQRLKQLLHLEKN